MLYSVISVQCSVWVCTHCLLHDTFLQGKIEMEVEILTEQEAKARPAAIGRGEPNQHPFLSEPKYVRSVHAPPHHTDIPLVSIVSYTSRFPIHFLCRRPATSFLWLTSPWKSCKFIVWKYYKWHIIAAIALLLAVLLVAVWIYTIPVGYINTLQLHIVMMLSV